MFTAFAEMKNKVVNIDVISHNDKLNMNIAEVLRKNAKKERLLGESFFDEKRKEVQMQKAAFDLEDKLWLKTSQIFVLLAKDVEKLAEYKAKTAERYVEHEKTLLLENRALQVQKYEFLFNAPINRSEYENMSNENFDIFLNGLEISKNEKLEAERLEREEIAAKEKEIMLHNERKDLLIPFWQFMTLELKNSNFGIIGKEDFESMLNDLIVIKYDFEEKQELQRIENEKLKLEIEKQQAENDKIAAELKAKQDVEILTQKQLEQQKENERIAAEKLAKAPIKEQLNTWLDSFIMPNTEMQHEKIALIQAKFESFLAWAKKEIESI